MIRTPAPARVLRGRGALEAVAGEITWLGRRPLLVHGSVGEARVRTRLGPALAAAGVTPERHRHEGPTTVTAIGRAATAARAAGCNVVIGVGGGRVLDVAKAAAWRAGLPAVVVPTSPATCAAVTAIAVAYDNAGAWAGPVAGATAPELCVLDADALAEAPDRLLAAGVLDAVVKVREVRLAARRLPQADAWSTTAQAACAVLAGLVDPAAGGGALSWPPAPPERAVLAEAVVWLPGLIAGLAGEANKLAAAHAVHNALTLLPGHERSLHGELVALGLLVQEALDGADDAALAELVAWMRRLGVDPSLEGLGCGALWDDPDPVLAHALSHAGMRAAFPDVTAEGLAAALRRVDALAGRG